MPNSSTPGFINKYGQVLIHNILKPGSDRIVTGHELGCSKCGHPYSVSGIDIFERECPKCQLVPLGRNA